MAGKKEIEEIFSKSVRSGRRTYFDTFVTAYNRIQDNDNPFIYYFWDTHFKIQTTPFKYNKFIYSQFNGSDDLKVDISSDDFPAVKFDWNWINNTKSLAWNYFPNSNFTPLLDSAFDIELSLLLSFTFNSFK